MPLHRDSSRRLQGFARQLRHNATDAETKLWWILRSRKLAGFKFRRQYPVAGYILDFFCVKANLCVELDGGQHADEEARRYDERRTTILNERGIRVLRFWDNTVLKEPDVVTLAIYRALMDD
jgi:very-short-patch-repair endonuclease